MNRPTRILACNPLFGCWTKNRGGKPPKMDGENNGNPIKMDDLGVPYFWKHHETPICIYLLSRHFESQWCWCCWTSSQSPRPPRPPHHSRGRGRNGRRSRRSSNRGSFPRAKYRATCPASKRTAGEKWAHAMSQSSLVWHWNRCCLYSSMSSGEVLFAFACNDCSLADTVLWDGFLLSLKTYSHHHWSSAAGSADTSGLVTAAGVLLLAAPLF